MNKTLVKRPPGDSATLLVETTNGTDTVSVSVVPCGGGRWAVTTGTFEIGPLPTTLEFAKDMSDRILVRCAKGRQEIEEWMGPETIVPYDELMTQEEVVASQPLI